MWIRPRATAFASRLSIQLGWHLEASTDLARAVAASDICVTCTTAESPLLFAEHLHSGLFVAAVGADNPAKHEIDATALSRSRVVVDSLAACAAGVNVHHAIKAHAMTQQDVHGELSAIVAGRVPARSSRDQVFVFDSTGTALQDVAAAVLVYGGRGCRRCRPAGGAQRQTSRGAHGSELNERPRLVFLQTRFVRFRRPGGACWLYATRPRRGSAADRRVHLQPVDRARADHARSARRPDGHGDWILPQRRRGRDSRRAWR